MNPSESFSRPVNIDGGANDATPEDDGIGLPRARNTDTKRPRRGGGKGGGLKGPARWLLYTAAGAVALGVGGYLARRPIAEFAAESWLKSQGIPADVRIGLFSGSRLSGKLILGPESAPDVTIDTFDVDYRFALFPSNGLPMVQVRTIHLKKPVVRMDLTGGKLGLGTLTKLVEAQLEPGRPAGIPPESVVVENADVTARTDFGLIRARGGLRMTAGALTWLAADVAPTRLTGKGISGDLSGGTLRAEMVGDAVSGPQLKLLAQFSGDTLSLRSGEANLAEDAGTGEVWSFARPAITVDARLPYTSTATGLTAWAGALTGTVKVKAGAVSGPALSADALDGQLTLDGVLDVKDGALVYAGAADIDARTQDFHTGDTQARGLHLLGNALALEARLDVNPDYTLSGPLVVETASLQQGDMRFEAARLNLTDLAVTGDDEGLEARFAGAARTTRVSPLKDFTLEGLTLSLNGEMRSAADGWAMTLNANVSSRGQYTGLQKAAASRTAEPANQPPTPPGDAIIALDKALRPFELDARGLVITAGGQGNTSDFTVRAGNPIRLKLNGGGTATITPRGPIIGSRDAGAFDVVLDGPDLPQLTLAVTQARVDAQGLLSGAYALDTKFDIVPLTGAHLKASGGFHTTLDKAFVITLPQPVTLTANAADIGDHLTEVKAQLSQRGNTPLFVSRPDGWRATVDIRDLSLVAAASAARVEDGAASADAYSIPGSDAVGMKVNVTDARLIDTAPEPQRFNPLVLTGTLQQDTKAMTGRFIAATPNYRAGGKNHPIAKIDLINDPNTGAGRLDVKTVGTTFAPDQLQAADLSPLLGLVMTRDVVGSMDFTGGFQWTKDSATSGGDLHVEGIDFTSNAGRVLGFKGDIRFTSLAPLLSDPGQVITVTSLNPGLPLEDLEIAFQFKGDRVAIERGGVMTPGGPIRLEPMDYLFEPGAPIKGTLAFDGLDFGEIVKSTDLSKSLTFRGKVSGRVPFVYQDNKLTVTDGYLRADAPGRLSVLRQAVADFNAGGSLIPSEQSPSVVQAAENMPNAMQDLAFQAIEHLAYDSLDARIYSSPGGKLTFNFHIKGRSDPPVYQPSPKIPIVDFLTGKWAEKPMKLPSNTPVELYLEMPINLDEILQDLTAFGANPIDKALRPGGQ